MGWEAMTPEDRAAWFADMGRRYGSGIVGAVTGSNDFLRDILEGTPGAVEDAIEGKTSQIERFHPEDADPDLVTEVEAEDIIARERVAGVFDKLGRRIPPMFVAGSGPGGGDPTDTAQWFQGSNVVVRYDLSKTVWGRGGGGRAPFPGKDGPGSSLVAVSEADILTHEYGHAYFDFMPGDRQGEWTQLFRRLEAADAKRWETYREWNGPDKFARELAGETPVPCPTDRSISYYAAENFNEAFGETFLLVMRGDYDIDNYDSEWQDMIRWMEKELGR